MSEQEIRPAAPQQHAPTPKTAPAPAVSQTAARAQSAELHQAGVVQLKASKDGFEAGANARLSRAYPLLDKPAGKLVVRCPKGTLVEVTRRDGVGRYVTVVDTEVGEELQGKSGFISSEFLCDPDTVAPPKTADKPKNKGGGGGSKGTSDLRPGDQLRSIKNANYGARSPTSGAATFIPAGTLLEVVKADGKSIRVKVIDTDSKRPAVKAALDTLLWTFRRFLGKPAAPADPAKKAREQAIDDAMSLEHLFTSRPDSMNDVEFAATIESHLPGDMASMLAILANVQPKTMLALRSLFGPEHRIPVALDVISLAGGGDSTPDITQLRAAIIALPTADQQALIAYAAQSKSPACAALVKGLAEDGAQLENDPVGVFKSKLKDKAIAALDANLQVLKAEEAKYADTSADNPAWTQLRNNAIPLINKSKELDRKINDLSVVQGALSGGLTEIESRHDSGASGRPNTSAEAEAKALLEEHGQDTKAVPSGAGGAPTENSSGGMSALKASIESIGARLGEARRVRTALKAEYPIIAGLEASDFKGGKSNQQILEHVRTTFFADCRAAIKTAKTKVRTEDVGLHELGPIIREVRADMALDTPDKTDARKAVDTWLADEKEKEATLQLALAGVSLVLGIASLCTGGATAILLGVLGSAVGLTGAAIELEAADDLSDIASAGNIGNHVVDDPDVAKQRYWMALLDTILAGLDLLAAVKAARTAAKLRQIPTGKHKVGDFPIPKAGELKLPDGIPGPGKRGKVPPTHVKVTEAFGHEAKVAALEAEFKKWRGFKSAHPVEVCIDPAGDFYLVNGHHRVEAARRVGLKQIPYEVVDPRAYQYSSWEQLAQRAVNPEGS